MKMSLRILSGAMACVLCLLALVGCHGKNIENAQPVSSDNTDVGQASYEPLEFDENKKYEVVFWAKNDTNMTQVGIYKDAVADFEALYPNIDVVLRLYTNYGDIYNDVIKNRNTNTTPNVCITYPDHVATYLTGKDVILQLDRYINDENYGLGGKKLKFETPKLSQIVPEFLNECRFDDGYYYALPYMRSTEALYINKTYVEKLGYTLPEMITWDFIWEVSEAALAENADGTYVVNGKKTLIPFIYKSTDNMMIQMLWQKNADYSNSSGHIFLFNDVTRELLLEISKHGKNRAFSTFKISSYPANFLNRGECIFAIDSTAGATWMGTNSPLSDIHENSVVEFETAVYPIPQFDTQDPKMISQGPSVCVFDKGDKGEVLASWLFTMFLLTNKVQMSYAQTEGYLPVTTSVLESSEYKDYLARAGEDDDFYYDIKLRATELLLDNIENTFVTPVFNGSASVRDAAGYLIEEVTKSVRRNETVDDKYIDRLYDKAISLYELDRKNIFDNADVENENTEDDTKLTELGVLPLEAKVLIFTLIAVWIAIGLYFFTEKSKKSKK